MFQNEARLSRIADVLRCWCSKPLRPVCQAIMTQEDTYAYGAVSVLDGVLDTLILPRVNRACMPLFLDEMPARHSHDRIVMLIDDAG